MSEREQRHYWTFRFHEDTIRSAAEKLCAHHTQREAFYRAKVEASQQEIKDKGLTVDPGQNKPNTTYIAPKVIVDATIAQRIAEEERSRAEHATHAKVYAEWARVLTGNGGFRELTMLDVLFFELATP